MAMTFTILLPDDALQPHQLEEIRRIVGVDGNATTPAGMIAHLESKTSDGWRIVDVWESDEHFDSFFESKLAPAFAQTGFPGLGELPPREPVLNVVVRQDASPHLAQDVYAAFTANDHEAIDRLIAADVVEHEEMPGIPPGREGVKTWLSMMHAAFADLTFTYLDSTGSGDRSAARFRLTGRHVGDFMGMPATGNRIDVEGIDYIRCNSAGQCVEHWGALDSGVLMGQLGVPAQREEMDLRISERT